MITSDWGQVEALWCSVEHWFDNWSSTTKKVNYNDINIYDNTCACCQYDYDVIYNEGGDDDDMCKYCLIASMSGDTNCKATPWKNVYHAMHGAYSSDNEIISAIETMYSFLVELACTVEFSVSK